MSTRRTRRCRRRDGCFAVVTNALEGPRQHSQGHHGADGADDDDGGHDDDDDDDKSKRNQIRKISTKKDDDDDDDDDNEDEDNLKGDSLDRKNKNTLSEPNGKTNNGDKNRTRGKVASQHAKQKKINHADDDDDDDDHDDTDSKTNPDKKLKTSFKRPDDDHSKSTLLKATKAKEIGMNTRKSKYALNSETNSDEDSSFKQSKRQRV
jgi:hypothetical protein